MAANTTALLLLQSFKKVPHLAFLGLKIGPGNLRDARLTRDTLDHADPRVLQLPHFFRIVRKQPDLRGPKFLQNSRGKIIISRVRRESQLFVGLHRVHPSVLQLIRAQLVHQSDATPLLRQIEQDARSSLADFLKREFKLRAAIAAQRRQHIAGQAL